MKNVAAIVLGLVVMGGVRVGLGAEASEPAVPRADIVFVSPVDHQVFQRNVAGDGTIVVEGHLENGVPAGLEARAVWMGKESLETQWHALKVASDKHFSGALMVSQGGWYEVEVRAAGEAYDVLGTVQHVGVGEVFVVGGQSNSTNYGEVKTKSTTGMVTVFDGSAWTLAADPLPGVDGKGGSPWCAFGDALVEQLHVPIGIVPVGKGSTSVRQWLPKGDVVAIEPSRTYGLKKQPDGTWINEGTLFDRMVARMKSLGPHGFRAMLWHQGESDAHQSGGHTLPGKDYREDLERAIRESRKQAGWDVPWVVATATWGSPKSPADPDIRAAQQGVIADGVAFAGPDTDALIGDNRQKNGTGVHMSAKGLKAHGELWAKIVGEWIDATKPAAH